MNSWKDAIDKAVQMCGTQRKLAAYLHIDEAFMSKARAGKQPLSEEKLRAISELINVDCKTLWELQEVAQWPRRNPFLRMAEAVAVAFLGVVLSVAQTDANAIAIGANGQTGGVSTSCTLSPGCLARLAAWLGRILARNLTAHTWAAC